MSTPADLERTVAGAARRVIAEHGWTGLTLARVADAAGVSRMTLHRRGLGREEIFQLLALAYEADFGAALSSAVDRKDDPRARLEAALVAVCAVTERHLDFLVGLDEDADTKLFHEDGPVVASRRTYVAALEETLAAGMRAGVFRRHDVGETATVLVNAVDRTYRHLRRAHGWAPARARDHLVQLLLRGLDGTPS